MLWANNLEVVEGVRYIEFASFPCARIGLSTPLWDDDAA